MSSEMLVSEEEIQKAADKAAADKAAADVSVTQQLMLVLK
jgi:hypothetical protein